MNELNLIRKLRAKARKTAGLTLGIGDDCAVFRPRAGEDLVFTTDLFLEDVHFRRDGFTAGEAGWRALARSLSDIAAMGATPRFCLVSLALAPWTDEKWFDGFYRGLLRCAKRYGVALAGGDLSHAEKVACDVMVCGAIASGKALRRDGARVGDAIYVTGPLGGWKHKKHVEPRIEEGRKLLGKATAAMDLSDGLSLDLHRLCVASQVAAELDREPPLLPGATAHEALHDGEDYELLYTAPEGVRVKGHRIGTIVKGPSGRVRYLGKPLPALGYDHFSRNRSRSD